MNFDLGKIVSVLGLITAIAAASAAQFGAINAKWGLSVTFLGAMASALGKALVTRSSHWVLTVLGISIAVATVIASQADLFGPEIVRLAGSVGAVLTALGKGFGDWWSGNGGGGGGVDLSGRPPGGNQYSF